MNDAPAPGALLLARVRFSHAAVAQAGERAAAARIAEACGGELVTTTDGRVTTRWTEGHGILPDEATGALTPPRLRVLAIAVALCWPRPTQALWPGQPTSLAALHQHCDGDGAAASWTAHHVDRLVREGLLELAESTLSLGPRVAAWDGPSVAALAANHDQLRALLR